MASWKDGAAYAPVERPDGFATPLAGPLPSAEPYRAATPGPVAQPERFQSTGEQPPLERLGPDMASGRDPRDSFEIAASLMTAHGGPNAQRDPRQPFATVASTLSTQPAPTGEPLPPPVGQQPLGSMGPPPGASPHLPVAPGPPAPLTGYAAPPSAPPKPSSLIVIAAVMCFVGFITSVASPYFLLVAGVLAGRVKPVTGKAGAWASGLGLLGIVWQFLELPLGTGPWTTLCLGFAIYFATRTGRRAA